MNTNMIINKLNLKQNGQFFKVSYVSDLPITAAAKKAGHNAYKVTEATVRKGIHYKSQKAYKEKMQAMGLPVNSSNPLELPWGTWQKGNEGLVIEHKGQNYIRLYTTPNKAKSRYYVDGVEVSLEGLKNSGLVQNSYFNKSGELPLAMTIKAENIQEIL